MRSNEITMCSRIFYSFQHQIWPKTGQKWVKMGKIRIPMCEIAWSVCQSYFPRFSAPAPSPPHLRLIWKKSRRIPSAFWDLRRKSIFPFFHEWFGKVDKFLGPNGAKHEINSSERSNYSLSDGAKQNSVRSIVFELWFF